MDKELSTGLTAGALTIIVSVLSLVLSKYFERKHEVLRKHREKKIPIYEDFLEFWFRLLLADKLGKKPLKDQEISNAMAKFTQNLIIWGSNEVIRAYFNFRQYQLNIKDSILDYVVFNLFENMLFEIRRDLGQKNRNIKENQILGLFINDLANIKSG